MSETSKWLEETRSMATVLSEAYRLQLSEFWWPNLMFVALPAVLSTSAAIFAALPAGSRVLFSLPAASVLAGSAAVLMAVHKALKCDEHQAECLRLGQAYKSIAISANSALMGSEELHEAHKERLTNKLEMLAESAKAQLPTRHIQKAQSISGRTLSVVPVA
jgi:hypothetical protein